MTKERNEHILKRTFYGCLGGFFFSIRLFIFLIFIIGVGGDQLRGYSHVVGICVFDRKK